LKEKIHYKPVLAALRSIIEQTKKKADAKTVCLELEEKIQELMDTKDNETIDNEVTDSHLMPPPSTVPRNKKSIRRSRRKSMSDEDEDSSDDSEEDEPIIKCKFKIDFVNVFYTLYVIKKIYIQHNIILNRYAQ